MTQFYEVNEARGMPGLKLVLTKGVPNPWAEAAKAVFEVKRIPFLRVAQRVMRRNADLQDWTGQTSAPAVILDDQKPRTNWSDIIFLAEQMQPEPALIPRDPRERLTMFGFLHEIAGQMGFGWCRRLLFTHGVLSDSSSPIRAVGEYIGGRYGYAGSDPGALERRVREIAALFAKQLRDQRERGSRFFVGERLTAADLYWAASSRCIEPLPETVCDMEPVARQLYTLVDPEMRGAIDPILLEHRDWVYQTYLTLPVQLR